MLGSRFLLACVVPVLLARSTDAFSVEETEYVVEVLAVLDPPGIDKWMKRDAINSMDDIRKEMAAMFLEVDNVYQSFRHIGINIHIRLFDLHFAEVDIFEGKWDSNHKISPTNGLEAFSKYIENANVGYYVNDRLSGPDHSMFFTTADIESAVGVTYLGTLCSITQSISLVPADFKADTIRTMAHEIGHSLNLDHDIDNSDCSVCKFVMYTYSTTGYNWRSYFSDCSLESLYKELDSTGDDSCMLMSSSDPVVSPRMGQMLTMDQFCQVGGNGVGGEPGKNTPSSMCDTIKCWDGMYSSWYLTTPEGLTCDEGKRCYNLNCV